jgi:hypothetical protein
MKRIALHLLVSLLSLSCGIGTTLLWKAHKEKVANRERAAQQAIEHLRPVVPVTAIVIQPQSPISIVSITKKTARVFEVEVMNVGSKPISDFGYTSYKRCSTDAIPAGGGVGFLPDKPFLPGEKREFEAGEEDPVRPQSIQDCLDNATRIDVQIHDVRFTDGTRWETVQVNKSPKLQTNH